MTTACMGGWCARRDHCANYHAASVDQQPAERLCPPGQDGAGLQEIEDMTVTKTTIERVRAALADGMSIAEISQIVGVHPTNARGALHALVQEGAVHTCRDQGAGNKQHVLRAFLTGEARDKFVEAKRATKIPVKQRHRQAYQAKQKAIRAQLAAERVKKQQEENAAKEAAKRAEAQAAAQRRALAAAEAEQRKQRARLEREAKAAEKARAKAEAKKTQTRLKAETKAAGAMPKLKAATPAPVSIKVRGPAFVAGEPDMSRARITIAPTPRDRFAPDVVPSVVNSREARAWVGAVA